MHSATNPSPGLGIVRSLRAHPEPVQLAGLDYSPISSGLHSTLLDERICMPSWHDIDLPTWVEQIDRLVGEASVFISSLDLEVRLIAQEFNEPDRFLSPSKDALSWVSKPPVRAGQVLGLATAEYLNDPEDPFALAEFVRGCSEGAWAKGQHYEAIKVHTFRQAQAAGEHITSTWGYEWHLERHISGQEAGIALVALNGRLVDCVFMRKTVLTGTGKTWAGSIGEVPAPLRARIREWVATSNWHGGAELELVESWDGQITLMEINPRLPAWIHGATVVGRNLPLALITGTAQGDLGSQCRSFTRVVEEILINPSIGAPGFPWSVDADQGAPSKHPSGMPTIAQRGVVKGHLTLAANGRLKISRPTGPSTREDQHVFRLPHIPSEMRTPQLRLDPSVLTQRLQQVKTSMHHQHTTWAYSVKTNPAPELIREALRQGMAIEVITQDEMNLAVSLGAEPGRLILNGPAKWWPAPQAVDCRVAFIDSVAEFDVLEDLLERRIPVRLDCIGIRISRLSIRSRFGVKVDAVGELAAAATRLLSLSQRLSAGWGLQFHWAQSSVGTEQWLSECAATFRAAEPLAELMGAPPTLLDFGGGWHYNDLDQLGHALTRLAQTGSPILARQETPWLFELGKSMLEGTGTLFSRVLVGSDTRGDIVVDAGIAELPEGPFWPHPVLLYTDGGPHPIRVGEGRILGRTCMEADILARGLDLAGVRRGDLVAFQRAGGYDASMAYEFGRGRYRQDQWEVADAR